RAFGEDMKITSLIVKTSTSTDNVALYANGSQIGSTATLTGNASSTFNLGSSLVVAAGATVTLEVRGDLKISGVNQTAGGSVQVSLIGVASNAQGLSSSNLIAVPGSANVSSTVTGPTMSIVNAGLTIAKNSSFNDSSTVSNTTGQKIGSFILQTTSSEAARISALSVTLGGTISTSNLANLYVVVSGMTATNPVNPQTTNNITVPTFEIPVSASKTVDIYADVLNTTGTASTTLTVTGSGAVSGADISGSAIGQTVTVGAGSLNTPQVLTSISPVPQFVLGGTSGIAIYTLKATSTNGTSIINELGFVTAGSASNAITSITVNGVTGQVAQGATTTLTGLNLSVPASYTGVQIPVTVAFNTVGTNGITSNQTAGLSLTYVKYTSGNTVTTSNIAAVSSQVMTIVAGKPIVTLVTGTRSGLSNTSVKLADITVKADGNAINLDTLPLSVSSTGVATIATSTSALVVKVGGTTISTATSSPLLQVAAGSTGTTVITFTGGYNIPKDSTVTFSVYATASTVSGAVNTTSLSTSLGTAGSFTWTDVEGNVSGITGALINPYTTTDSSVITN
ncbi:MAG: hypothetical protein WCW14_02600, partial [Candidatus Paceibacterota bacterium]